MYYVMSDIHGCYSEMKEALRLWNPKKEHLVILGDLIDKGPDSLLVVNELMELKNKYSNKVIIIKGNHEEMFTSWLLNSPFEMLAYNYNHSHNETIKSFFNDYDKFRSSSRRQRAEHIIYNNKSELRFLENLPYFLETENIIFVHAGIDISSVNWKENKTKMLWARNEFIYSNELLNKLVLFGHTPTSIIRNNNDNNIWISPNKDKICLDGGIAMGGQLNSIKINKFGEIIEIYKFQ